MCPKEQRADQSNASPSQPSCPAVHRAWAFPASHRTAPKGLPTPGSAGTRTVTAAPHLSLIHI